MTLTCPKCKNKLDFTTIGIPGKIQCGKCGITLDVEENFTEDKS